MHRIAVLVLVLAAGCAVPAAAAAGPADDELATGLLSAVRATSFAGLVDFGTAIERCPGARDCRLPAPRARVLPNLDVAVIELDARGRAVAAANVLVSPDHPRGVAVPTDVDRGVRDVRFRRWSTARWARGRGWDVGLDAGDDIVGGRSNARYEFMSPYPASVFKLMVAYRVLQLVDHDRLRLSTRIRYEPRGPAPECPGGAARVRTWLEEMITVSSNRATCALIKLLHDRGQLGNLNDELRRIGLDTLQLRDTSPLTGRHWTEAGITMTAFDTARLAWLLDGGRGVLWRPPGRAAVRSSRLSGHSRRFLRRLLRRNVYADTLSSTVFCGLAVRERRYPTGIPHAVASRWIDRVTGAVRLGSWTYATDARPCNARAEVSFAHKIGWTWGSASDAGVVRSLPGQPHRRYAIAVFSSAGRRFADPIWASARRSPCDTYGICHTDRFARLGAAIDRLMAQ